MAVCVCVQLRLYHNRQEQLPSGWTGQLQACELEGLCRALTLTVIVFPACQASERCHRLTRHTPRRTRHGVVGHSRGAWKRPRHAHCEELLQASCSGLRWVWQERSTWSPGFRHSGVVEGIPMQETLKLVPRFQYVDEILYARTPGITVGHTKAGV